MHVPLPRRAGERWTDTENAQLVDMLRDGLPLTEVAQRLQRGVDAVASHCQSLLPPGIRVRRAEAELLLREELADDPDYDWRAGLRAEAARRGAFYWEPAHDAILRKGWANQTPLIELVTATGASEIEVAQRLVALGLARGMVDVADRLGATPDATLNLRVRMAADRSAAAVWVLIVDGARDSERARALDRPGTAKVYRHVSIHATAETAEQTLIRLLVGHTNKGGTAEEITVTLAQRTVGDLAVGATHHEQAPTLHALDSARPPKTVLDR
jgi:hypothetical protein